MKFWLKILKLLGGGEKALEKVPLKNIIEEQRIKQLNNEIVLMKLEKEKLQAANALLEAKIEEQETRKRFKELEKEDINEMDSSRGKPKVEKF